MSTTTTTTRRKSDDDEYGIKIKTRDKTQQKKKFLK